MPPTLSADQAVLKTNEKGLGLPQVSTTNIRMNQSKMKDVKPLPAEDALVDGVSQVDIEVITEKIWGDLEGKASRSDIRRVLAEITPAYDDARIKTYVPIFLHRDVVQRLQSGFTIDRRSQAHEPVNRKLKGNS